MPSLQSCPATPGSLVGKFVILTTAFESVFEPVIVWSADTVKFTATAPPAALNKSTLYALTDVEPPDVLAAFTTVLVPLNDAVNVN